MTDLKPGRISKKLDEEQISKSSFISVPPHFMECYFLPPYLEEMVSSLVVSSQLAPVQSTLSCEPHML